MTVLHRRFMSTSGCRFRLADMRNGWNGFRCVALTSFLLAFSPIFTGNPTDSLAPKRDRIRRHGLLNLTSTHSGWTPQCSPQCFGNVSAQELKRNYRLDSVKDDILRKLKMSEPPNMTGRVPDVPAMQLLLSQMNNGTNATETSDLDSLDMDHVTPTTFILLSQIVPPDKRSSFPNSCYFTFSPELRNNLVITAQLGVYLRQRGTHSDASPAPMTLLIVYRINRSPNGSFSKMIQRRRRISLTPLDTGRWQLFDAKALVEHWMRHPRQNYGIQIAVTDFRGDPIAVLPTGNQSQDALTPYIDVQIVSRPSNRPRRSIGSNCVEANVDPRCCRYPLTIDFDAFRWDWVIVPKRYEAYYCSGECPFLFQQRNSHTHLFTQMAQGLGAPCCAPTNMSPLKMIYIDSNHRVVYGELPSMIVERCGCS